MINFIKSHKKIVIFVITLIVFVIFLAVIFSPTGQNSNTVQQSTGVVFNFLGIKPGETKKSDVVAKLGQPISETKRTSGNVDEFKSESLNRRHEITFDTSNVVKIVKQIITASDKKTVSDITKVYGSAETILYGSGAVDGIYLYAYPSKGIAFLGNVQSDTLFEIWYFSPTTLDLFTVNFASGYVNDMKKIQPGF